MKSILKGLARVAFGLEGRSAGVWVWQACACAGLSHLRGLSG
ncbi:MAG TPA: hypothetical protein VN794_15740 [Methylomirabilota bacterium]|nr:hypothetical protein [Methylomirabilota bacterium]